MPVPAIDVTQMGSTQQAARVPKQSMDGEVFLHLLVTQLSNQDPSSPMDTNEMIAQTTQLASMERLNALADTQASVLDVQQRAAAAALIGSTAETAGENPVSGIVTAVSFASGTPTVTIGDVQVPYADIVGVRAATPSLAAEDVPA